MVTTYSLTPGMRYDSHGWQSYVYLDTFPHLVRAELGSPDTLTGPTISSGASLASANSLSTPTTINISATTAPAVGDYISIGYPGTSSSYNGTLETHQVASVTGTSPNFTVTLVTNMNYVHAAGEPVTGLTKHKFSLLNNAGQGNQPPSYSLFDFAGDEWRALSAGQEDELTITGNATELLQYNCTWFANPALSAISGNFPGTSIAVPTVSYSSVRPVPSYTTAMLIGGAQSFDVEEYEIDLKRGVKPIPAFTGTQEYFEYFAGPIQTTGHKATVIYQADATFPHGQNELTQFQNGVNQAFDFYSYDIWTGNAMRIHSSNVMWVTGELTRSKEYVELTMTFDFLPSASDATAGGVSPLYIEVANSITTAY